MEKIKNGYKYDTPTQFRNDDSGRYCDGYIFCEKGFQGTGCERNGINGKCVSISDRPYETNDRQQRQEISPGISYKEPYRRPANSPYGSFGGRTKRRKSRRTKRVR